MRSKRDPPHPHVLIGDPSRSRFVSGEPEHCHPAETLKEEHYSEYNILGLFLVF